MITVRPVTIQVLSKCNKLLAYLVGAGEEWGRNGKTKRFGGL